MELPIKFDIPRLSHSDLLNICLPIIPGLVLGINAVLGGLRPLAYAATFGFGYKTGLTLCVILTYLLGLALTQIVSTLFSWIASKRWPAQIVGTYDDPYWRHLMYEYLGSAQCPDAMSVSSETAANRLDKFVARNPEAHNSRLKVAAKIREVETQFEEKTAEIKSMPEGQDKVARTTLLESLRAKKNELLKEREASTIKQTQEYAWLQLSSAMIFTESESPYEGYDSLMLAFLTSSLIQFCFSAIVFSKSSLFLLPFSGALILVTIYGRSQVFRLGRSHLLLNTKVIASLIRELKARKDKV